MAAAALGTAGCERAIGNPFFRQDLAPIVDMDMGNPFFGDLAVVDMDMGNPFFDMAPSADLAPADGSSDLKPDGGGSG